MCFSKIKTSYEDTVWIVNNNKNNLFWELVNLLTVLPHWSQIELQNSSKVLKSKDI